MTWLLRRRASCFFLCCSLLFNLAANAVLAQHATPAVQGHVNDLAQLLPPQERVELEQALRQVATNNGIEIGILTLASLEGDSIERFATQVYRDWGLGKKGEDKGLLIVVVRDDKQARIEVGYGLEHELNDAAAGRLLREVMIPHFRQGDYAQGLRAGLFALSQELHIDLSDTLKNTQSNDNDTLARGKISLAGKVFRFLMIALFIYLLVKHPWLLLLLLNSGGRGRGSSGGGFGRGGGFGGFGGGMSGGGGASGRW